MPYDLDEIFPRRQPEPPYHSRVWVDIVILLIVAFFVLIAVCWTQAQTVSPVIQEMKGPRVKGELTVTNNGLTPLAVIIEPMSVAAAVYEKLHPDVHVKLEASSMRLGPKQSAVIAYEVLCDAMPCIVNLNSVFQGLKTKSGVSLALALPSVLYICEKQKGCRASVLAGWVNERASQ